VFDQASGFLSKHRYEKIAATVRTTWNPIWTRSSIRKVSQFKSRRLDASQHGLDVRASDMEIVCISSTVRTTILLVRTRKAFIWITRSGRETVRKIVHHRPDAALKHKRSSAKFSKFRSHSCPSGRRSVLSSQTLI
jgi:hypothetical protein